MRPANRPLGDWRRSRIHHRRYPLQLQESTLYPFSIPCIRNPWRCLPHDCDMEGNSDVHFIIIYDLFNLTCITRIKHRQFENFVVCLFTEMKNFLKYILISILALLFYDGVKNDSSCGEYDLIREFQVEHRFEQETLVSSPRTDICPPRQVSTLSVPRVQTNSRHDSSSRNISEFVKFGKTISSGCNYIAQNKTLIQYSPSMDPGHKLVSLCRFII